MKKRKRFIKTSKYLREYGMTIGQIAEKYNQSIYYLSILHQRNELHAFIEEQEKKAEAVRK